MSQKNPDSNQYEDLEGLPLIAVRFSHIKFIWLRICGLNLSGFTAGFVAEESWLFLLSSQMEAFGTLQEYKVLLLCTACYFFSAVFPGNRATPGYGA